MIFLTVSEYSCHVILSKVFPADFGALKSMPKLWANLYFQSKCTQCGGSFSFRRNLALVCDSFSICIVFEAFSPLGRFVSYFGRRIEQLFLNGMLLSASHYLGNVEYLARHGLLAHVRLFGFLYSVAMSLYCDLSQIC